MELAPIHVQAVENREQREASSSQLPSKRPSQSGPLGLAGLTMAQIERQAIIETIQACDGNRAKAARQLAVSEKTIYNKIKQYNLRGLV